MLPPDKVPSLKLPALPMQVSPPPPRRPLLHCALPEPGDIDRPDSNVTRCDAAVNTDLTGADLDGLERELRDLKDKLTQVECASENLRKQQTFRLGNISDDDNKVRFYTGFTLMAALMVCFNFFGPYVNMLNYWSSSSASAVENQTKSAKG